MFFDETNTLMSDLPEEGTALTYTPAPIDTGSRKLPATLVGLLEMLAASIHDVWATQRIADGWTFGPQRDDATKKHPDLRPYHELADAEKEYDRKTVAETLKTILALGYEIKPPDHANAAPDFDELKARIQRLRQEGKALQAYDAATKGLEHWPDDVRLAQLKALALADSGAAQAANKVLRQLLHQGRHDEETLSLLGRTYKQLWRESSDTLGRIRSLALCFGMYKRCYARTRGYYPGVNAATAAALLGKMSIARTLAAEVRAQCLELLAAKTDSPYYLAATLGEASLILGELGAAVDWYAQAAALGRGNYRDIFSTRYNARLLLEKLRIDGAGIEAALRLPRVAVFTGHMVDRPGRPVPRFPGNAHGLEQAVRAAIDREFVAANVGFGYSSAAAGGDIIFQEALEAAGLEGHIALPYRSELFIRDSVDLHPQGDWLARYQRLLDRLGPLDAVELASDWPIQGGVNAFAYANQILLGLAVLHQQRLMTELVPIALWDGKRGDGRGGAEDTITWWESLGHCVKIIDLEALKAGLGLELATTPSPPPAVTVAQPTEPVSPTEQGDAPEVRVMALLFADVVNYSKLPEPLVPTFVRYFMGGVADLLDARGCKPAFKNEWGDAIYLAFDDVREAGLVALDLAAFVSGYDWSAVGLPASLNLRIGLHAGPVYLCEHRVVGQRTCTGTHVNRAARIEPVTPPGYAYASQSFAALAAAAFPVITEFACDYVGQLKLAKDFGSFPMYRVRPTLGEDARRAQTRTKKGGGSGLDCADRG